MKTSAASLKVEDRNELAPIAESDLIDLSRFIAAQSGRSAQSIAAHLQWFLLENPARGNDMPLGWGMRSSAGDLVGCILCAPQTFRFRESVFTVMGSSSFYVDSVHRGAGSLIFLRFSRMASRWALFGNSANALAASLWKARGAMPIPDSDHELFGVLHWSPLAEEILARKIGTSQLSRVAGIIASPLAHVRYALKFKNPAASLTPLTSAEQVMDLCIDQPSTKLTAARDLPYIRWRYFSGRDSTVALFSARSPQFEGEVFVAVNKRPRGYRSQIRTLNLLDVYPEVPSDGLVAISTALMDRHRDKVDAFVVRGQARDHQSALQRAGFLRRTLDAPNGWLLDKSKLLPTRDWYFVPADGDWLI